MKAERKTGTLRAKEVAKLVGVAESTIWLKASEGKFPKPVKMFDRVTVWKADDVYEFLDRLGEENPGGK